MTDQRKDIPEKYKWDLTAIYPDMAAFDADFEKALSFVREEAGGRPVSVELNVNRNNQAVGFYRHLGMEIRRQGDFHIGNGFYMNDYIMGLDLD